MLTGDLVRVRSTKDGLKCGFVDAANDRMLEKAAAIIAAFQEHVGETRGALDEALLEVEGDGVDHKLTRGLAKLCFDRAEFNTQSPIPPDELRRAAFGLAARVGPLALVEVGEGEGEPARTARRLWADLAAELGQGAEALERALYADLPSEQRLVSVDVPSASWLLHRYNVALVQAVVVRARAVTLTLQSPAPGELRALCRAIKFHQLLAEVRPAEAGLTITIDGPASLFSQTTRYGLALARFFPAVLLLASPWNLKATVAWGNRAVSLDLDGTLGLVSHYRAQGNWQSREAAWFAERWAATVPGWTITEGGVPLDQGGEALVVPDFRLRPVGERGDKRDVHVEILGYWRKGSLERRLELTRRHGPARLILAVSKKLLQGEARDAEGLPPGVVLFGETVPVKEVLRVVEGLGSKDRQPHPRE